MQNRPYPRFGHCPPCPGLKLLTPGNCSVDKHIGNFSLPRLFGSEGPRCWPAQWTGGMKRFSKSERDGLFYGPPFVATIFKLPTFGGRASCSDKQKCLFRVKPKFFHCLGNPVRWTRKSIPAGARYFHHFGLLANLPRFRNRKAQIPGSLETFAECGNDVLIIDR